MKRLVCIVTTSLLLAGALNAQAQDTKQKTTTAPVNHLPIATRTVPGQPHATAPLQPPSGLKNLRPSPYTGPWIGTPGVPGGHPPCLPGMAPGAIVNGLPCG